MALGRFKGMAAVAALVMAAAGAWAQDTVAVYMVGEEPKGLPNVYRVMSGELEKAIGRNPNYIAANRKPDVLRTLDKEHVYTRGGAVDDAQVKALGKQLGAQYLCLVEISAVSRGYYVTAQLVDAVGARIVNTATAGSRLESYNEMMSVAKKVALELTDVDVGAGQQELAAIEAESTQTGQEQEKPAQAGQPSARKPPSGGAATPAKTMFTDTRDSKPYNKVTIGAQVWMAQNLSHQTKKSKCNGNNSSHCVDYGRLYNWYDAKSACPAGWHLPSDEEWTILADYVGGAATAGTKLKSGSYWTRYNAVPKGVDEYGFTAMPGGIGSSDGSFTNPGDNGYWWSSSESNARNAGYRRMYYNYGNIYGGVGSKSLMFSVRCIQD